MTGYRVGDCHPNEKMTAEEIAVAWGCETLMELTNKFNIPYSTFRHRYFYQDWTVEDALIVRVGEERALSLSEKVLKYAYKHRLILPLIANMNSKRGFYGM